MCYQTIVSLFLSMSANSAGSRRHSKTAGVLEQVVVLDDLEVHFGRVLVGAFGEVDFSLGDMQQAVGVALAFHAGLFGVQHVVGTRSQFLDDIHRGRNPLKGLIIDMVF